MDTQSINAMFSVSPIMTQVTEIVKPKSKSKVKSKSQVQSQKS